MQTVLNGPRNPPLPFSSAPMAAPRASAVRRPRRHRRGRRGSGRDTRDGERRTNGCPQHSKRGSELDHDVSPSGQCAVGERLSGLMYGRGSRSDCAALNSGSGHRRPRPSWRARLKRRSTRMKTTSRLPFAVQVDGSDEPGNVLAALALEPFCRGRAPLLQVDSTEPDPPRSRGYTIRGDLHPDRCITVAHSDPLHRGGMGHESGDRFCRRRDGDRDSPDPRRGRTSCRGDHRSVGEGGPSWRAPCADGFLEPRTPRGAAKRAVDRHLGLGEDPSQLLVLRRGSPRRGDGAVSPEAFGTNPAPPRTSGYRQDQRHQGPRGLVAGLVRHRVRARS